MKHIKTFENVNNPEKGDYVIISYYNQYTTTDNLNQLSDFLNNTIGIVYKVYNNTIDIKYENIPYGLYMFFDAYEQSIRTNVKIDEILCYGKTIDEVKLKINSLKYNL